MKRYTTVLTLAVMAALLAAPLPAFAASAKPALPPARVTGPVAKIANIDVQVWPEDPTSPSGTTIIVVAQLPTGTPVPATVRLPLPAGAKIGWSGEVFAGTGSADVPRAYSIDTSGGNVVSITTQKSRYVQYEATYAAPRPQSGRKVETLDWLQSAQAGTVSFSFKLPLLASDVHTNPAFSGAPDVNNSGEKLYSLAPRTLAVGSAAKVSVDYLMPATSTASPVQRDLLLPILVGLLVIAAAGLAVVVMRQRRPAA